MQKFLPVVEKLKNPSNQSPIIIFLIILLRINQSLIDKIQLTVSADLAKYTTIIDANHVIQSTCDMETLY